MIGKLKGRVDSIQDDSLIVDVGGVGYHVFASGKTLSQAADSEIIELLIDTHVREDHIHLYGFINQDEKSTFLLLQSVKGVGNKMALNILSALSPSEISISISCGDDKAFTGVSGIGKKLAARIVNELKDKFSNAIGLMNNNSESSSSLSTGYNSNQNDAIMALSNLGVNRLDAINRVSNILRQNPNIDLNELIKEALKNNN